MKKVNYKKFLDIFQSLRTQLILYYMVISFVVLAAGAYFSYSYIMDILKRNSEKNLLQQFTQADYNIRNVLSEVDRLSKIFIYDESVQQFLQDNYNTSEFTVLETQNYILGRIGEFISNYDYISSIYIYTENKGGIGGSDRYTRIIRMDSEDKFFDSGMYEKVKEAFPRAVLEGGIPESFYRNYETAEDAFIISVARGVKPVNEPSRSASLIFNINEAHIASIYANSGSLSEASAFIADKNGKVVSGSNTESIGSSYGMFSAVAAGEDYGSFTSSNSGSSVQVVYYKLKDIELYLIGEIPLQYFSKDIIVIRRLLIIVFLASFLAVSAASVLWLRKLTRPLNIIAAKMSDVGRGNLGLTFSKIPRNEFGMVIKKFNEMSVNIVDLIRKNDEIQEGRRELELEALQFQINPHFLYNTLNMIKWMAAGIKAKNIVDCVIALGNILKPIFKSTGPMWAIKEELEYLENYIKIINWRYSNRVSFKLDINEEFHNYRLPRFILQPIIENSVKHGMQAQENRIEININIVSEEDMLRIIITDTGKGVESRKLEEINFSLEKHENAIQESSKDSIGLYNINRRIKLNFGEEYGISIENAGEVGTRVTIRIPAVR